MSDPGRRFQDRYDHRRHSSGGSRLGTVLYVFGGLAIVLVGIPAIPGPGPGWLILFLGLGFIAGEFRPLARFMDWVEVRLWRLARRAVVAWTRSTTTTKALMVLAIPTCAAVLVFFGYRLTFGG